MLAEAQDRFYVQEKEYKQTLALHGQLLQERDLEIRELSSQLRHLATSKEQEAREWQKERAQWLGWEREREEERANDEATRRKFALCEADLRKEIDTLEGVSKRQLAELAAEKACCEQEVVALKLKVEDGQRDLLDAREQVRAQNACSAAS